MTHRPGAQFQDHANMVAGRAALPRPLSDFEDFQFATQCPSPACRFRRFPVAAIAASRPGITVGDALARLRCQACGQPPEIVALSKPSVNAGETWIALRIEADQWKPVR
ncbi:hypothetical protein ACLF3G_24010 [Falsiroseomonas sp. HC035]|uniref:hypothetical protein n=1 Tax=Falsiroseomonas sp. HC035 TaxID=3390999 RepID=UPI003D31A0FD